MTRDANGVICGPCRACMAERDALKAEVERLKPYSPMAKPVLDEMRRLEAERDQARARVAELEAAYNAVIDSRHKQVTGLARRVTTLEAALRKYGRHRRDLPHPCMYPDGDCTCGLDAALAGGG